MLRNDQSDSIKAGKRKQLLMKSMFLGTGYATLSKMATRQAWNKLYTVLAVDLYGEKDARIAEYVITLSRDRNVAILKCVDPGICDRTNQCSIRLLSRVSRENRIGMCEVVIRRDPTIQVQCGVVGELNGLFLKV